MNMIIATISVSAVEGKLLDLLVFLVLHNKIRIFIEPLVQYYDAKRASNISLSKSERLH